MKSFKQYVLEGVQKLKRGEERAYRDFIGSTLRVGYAPKDIASAEQRLIAAQKRLELAQRIRAPRVQRAALRLAQAANKPTNPDYTTKDVMDDMEFNLSHFEGGTITPRLIRIANTMRAKS